MEVMNFDAILKNDNKPKYLKINSRDLVIPDHAQRKFKQAHGDNLAANWSMDKFKPLDVSFRDGKYWVIDGQHRLYAIKKRKGGDCTILCYVHYGMTIQDEAEFFLNQLKNTKPILTIDRMRIRFMTGDETVVGMVRGAEKAGFIVDFDNHKAVNRICALSSLEVAYKALSAEEYVKMLTVLKKAYNGRVDSLCREMLLGMALFFQTYYGQFDANALANSLKTMTTPADILLEGRSFSGIHGDGGIRRGKYYARAILNVYNKRRKQNSLPDKL